ncbi:hypothetical protein NTE_02669 [Candidatus Nitrososphaera evergladensis SR1]|uniref:Uncharacterized protein n=1 Tax=Candidatus Nitrososphaera evergladensis SR1 TaxID=1459636 RepID=A0A075MVQ1_9ARCH|nr:hypothetical protein NTE_02669 [Candidatus Nitrososphaera evergladensis SR1]
MIAMGEWGVLPVEHGSFQLLLLYSQEKLSYGPMSSAVKLCFRMECHPLKPEPFVKRKAT